MKLKPKSYKISLWIAVVAIIHLLFSYNLFKGWWYSGLGTIFVITISCLFWEKDCLKKIGLNLSIISIFISVILAGIALFGSWFIMKYIGRQEDVLIQLTGFENYIHDIFYTMNEEIILGAVLLFTLYKKLNLHPVTLSAIVAIIFSLAHFISYKWIFLERGILGIQTLSVLFLVGFFRNNLILRFRHIGFSWAFHFGWMAVMFGSRHYISSSDLRITEPDRFNLYLGSWQMLFISAVMAAASTGLFFYKSMYPAKRS